MAAAGANIGNTNLTFTRYLKGVVETLNHTSKSRKYAQKGDKWTGDKIETRLHVTRSGAIQPSEDGGAFPTPSVQGHIPMVVSRKFLHFKIQMTDGQIAAAAAGPNVAKPGVEAEVSGMIRDVEKYENFNLFRDGTGKVAELLDVSDADVPVVDDARGLWDTLSYEVRDATPSTLHAMATLKTNGVPGTLDSTLGKPIVNLTADLPGTVAAGDGLYWKNGYNRTITGLDAMIDDAPSVFQGVDVSEYPRWTPYVNDAGGTSRPLTPLLFRQVLAGLMQKAGDERPMQGLKVHTSSWQMINIEELYEGQIRLTPTSTEAGSSVASFISPMGRIDIEVDVDAPYGKIFFVDWSQIHRGVQKKMGWRPGVKGIFNPSQQMGVWEATGIEIAEMYIKSRITSAKLVDLEETLGTGF